MASYNNIFEVLQKVAENASSSEKLFGILKENGYKGTLEDAGREILKAEQVVLENLTSDDLKNIAGGKSLMKDKLKKIIAVGGASLMAGSATVPSQATTNKKTQEATLTKVFNHIKNNKVHSAFTGGFALTTVSLAIYAATLGTELRNSKKPVNITGIPADQVKHFLETKQLGRQLLYLLELNLTNGNAEEDITIELVGDDTGPLYETPTTAKLKIIEGTTDSGLCNEGFIMHGLNGKELELEKLAIFIAYTTGGEEELTTAPNWRKNNLAFVGLENDKNMDTYKKDYLNEIGQLLAKVIEDYLIDQLKQKYPLKAVKNPKEEIIKTDDEEQSESEEIENTEATYKAIDELLGSDLSEKKITKLLTVEYYDGPARGQKVTNSTQSDPKKVYVKLTTGNNGSDNDEALKILTGAIGTIDQMAYYVVSQANPEHGYLNLETIVESVTGEVKGLTDTGFSEKGKQEVKKLKDKLTTIYTGEKVSE